MSSYLESKMESRTIAFIFYYQFDYTENYVDYVTQSVNSAFSNVFEDDYLWGKTLDASWSAYDGILLDSTRAQFTIEVSASYLTSEYEESEIDNAVKRIVSGIDRTQSDYDQILAAYKYICQNSPMILMSKMMIPI